VFYFDQEPTLDQLNELILSGSLLNVTNLAEEVPEEKREIQLALEQTNYHATNTAKNLGISRATLYRKMKQYNIEK
jgi:transcriptional regulator of acetoin/glycerol metabolism